MLISSQDEGYLIMSGIVGQVDMVRGRLSQLDFPPETHMIQGEWNACVLKKTRIFPV